MTADELAGQLGARRSGNAWIAKCLAHDDDQPSLSISEGQNGRVLLKCHAGCDYTSIIAALKLNSSDLSGQQQATSRGDSFVIDRTYPYVDEHGEIIYEVVRLTPKGFRQRQPDPTAKSGWKWNLNGVRRVPYRLPQLLQGIANGQTVYLCEGEKDADLLVKNGLLATTTPQGADNWKDEFGEFFRGADVVILPDHDESGERYAALAARSLFDHVAMAIRILRLPGLANKQDVSDWLVTHTVDDLIRLADDSAEVYDPNAAPKPSLPVPDGWGYVVPLGADTPVPQFPINSLPSRMREMVKAVAEANATPVDFPATIALGTIAAIASRGLNVQAGGYIAPVNLYVTGVLPVGEGKSPVMRALNGELWKIESEWAAEIADEIVAAETAKSVLEKASLKAQQDAANAKDGTSDRLHEAVDLAQRARSTKIPINPRVIVTDATPEAVIKVCGSNGGTLAIVNDEGAEAFSINSRYSSNGSSNLGPILVGFDGDPYVADRATRDPIRIDRLVITSILCIQPGVLDDLARDKANRDRGLLARFLITMPESKIGYRPARRPEIPSSVSDQWNGVLRWIASIVNRRDEPMILAFDDDAFNAFLDHQEFVEPRMRPDEGDLHHLNDWANKSRAHVLRLAAILHLANCAGSHTGQIDIIRKPEVDRAVELWSYYAEHAKKVFSRMSESQDSRIARKMLRWIERHNIEHFTLRQIFQAVNGGIVGSGDDVQLGLLLLIQNGYIRRSATTKGRSEAYDVHPHITTNITNGGLAA